MTDFIVKSTWLRILAMAGLALPLTNCASSKSLDAGNTVPVTQLASSMAQPPVEISRPCEDPIDLSKSDGDAGGVYRDWATDRSNLAECKARHLSLVEFYRNRDQRLSKKTIAASWPSGAGNPASKP